MKETFYQYDSFQVRDNDILAIKGEDNTIFYLNSKKEISGFTILKGEKESNFFTQHSMAEKLLGKKLVL